MVAEILREEHHFGAPEVFWGLLVREIKKESTAVSIEEISVSSLSVHMTSFLPEQLSGCMSGRKSIS